MLSICVESASVNEWSSSDLGSHDWLKISHSEFKVLGTEDKSHSFESSVSLLTV